jgi:cyanosortase A-associated protein
MKQHHSLHLAILLLGIAVCIIKILINPIHNQQAAAILLPKVPISPFGWSLQQQELLKPSDQPERYDYLIEGRKYTFHNSEHQHDSKHQLLLELREIGNTTGDVKALQAKYSQAQHNQSQQDQNSINSVFNVKQTTKGEYYWSEQSNQVEFQTCLYRSRLSIRSEVFKKQAYREALRPQHLQYWFSGNKPLVNDRCLWVKATIKPAISTQEVESLLTEIARIVS